MNNKRLLWATSALLLTLALSACGGSGSDDGNGGNQAANPGASDAFLAQVLALIVTSPDNSEPVSIDAIGATSPDTIEPAML
jgi:hypothetical protein